jgi:hypothetical protein
MEGSTLGRWAQLDTEHGVNLAWGSKDVSHRVTLMPPLPKQSASDPTQVRTAQEERDNGMVAARYRFAPRTSTGYSPVNVELAWWSAVTGQVHRGVLPHVKAFRVSRFQFSGMARIVDGGLVFRGHDGDGMSFVHDDGKVETIASPDIPFDEVWHSGKRWVVADSGNAIVALAASEDGGKTWTQRSWGFAHVASMGIPEGPLQGGAEPTLQSINGSPKLRMNDWLVDVPSPLPDDPPAPTAIDTSGADMRCDATAVGTLRHAGQMDEASPLSIEISGKGAPEILETFTRVQHDTPSGKMCSSVYGLHEHNANWGDSHEAYLYPEKGGAWSGWYRRPSDTNKEQSVIEPLSCK